MIYVRLYIWMNIFENPKSPGDFEQKQVACDSLIFEGYILNSRETQWFAFVQYAFQKILEHRLFRKQQPIKGIEEFHVPPFVQRAAHMHGSHPWMSSNYAEANSCA